MALVWAYEHKLALIPASLDRKEFERIAPADIVTVTKEPRVQIATDLTKAVSGVTIEEVLQSVVGRDATVESGAGNIDSAVPRV